VPLPWSGHQPPYGFGPAAAQPWIPQPDDWGDLTVAAQAQRDDSTLAFYREALRCRRDLAVPAGPDVDLDDVDDELLSFTRGPLRVLLNCGDAPVALPPGAEVVLASGPVEHGKLPRDTAVWLRQA
jgi:alpha-glucosidase